MEKPFIDLNRPTIRRDRIGDFIHRFGGLLIFVVVCAGSYLAFS